MGERKWWETAFAAVALVGAIAAHAHGAAFLAFVFSAAAVVLVTDARP